MEPQGRTLLVELVETIARERGGGHPDRIARTICRHADGGIALVGLVADATEAIFFDPRYRRIYTVPVSPVGVHAAAARIIGRSVDDPREWLVDPAEEFAWIHPAFRASFPECVAATPGELA